MILRTPSDVQRQGGDGIVIIISISLHYQGVIERTEPWTAIFPFGYDGDKYHGLTRERGDGQMVL